MKRYRVAVLTSAVLFCGRALCSPIDPSAAIMMADAANLIATEYVSPVSKDELLRVCLDAVRNPHEGEPSTEQMEASCLQAMMTKLDRYSSYLGPKDFADLKLQQPKRQELAVSRSDDGLLRLVFSQFDQRTLEELAAALKAQDATPPLKGVVLDLRHCAGGSLMATTGVAAAFLPQSALLFKLVGRLPDASVDVYARRQYYTSGMGIDPLRRLSSLAKNVPLIVLTDAATASGAEMVAAALQDHGRARIIGQRTMGQGRIQTLRLLSRNQGIKLTTAMVIRANGAALDGAGVVPDIATAPDAADEIEQAIKAH